MYNAMSTANDFTTNHDLFGSPQQKKSPSHTKSEVASLPVSENQGNQGS